MKKEHDYSFRHVRQLLRFKQDYFGLLTGMGKQAISRLEKGKRKKTLIHKELLSLIVFLHQKKLINEYVEWRFGFSVKKHFKISTPLDD